MPARRAPLPPALRDQPFTRATARLERVPCGVLRGPGVRTLVRGVYLSSEVDPTLAHLLSAHLTVLPPETAVDGVTALWVSGVEVGRATPYRFVTTATHHSQ